MTPVLPGPAVGRRRRCRPIWRSSLGTCWRCSVASERPSRRWIRAACCGRRASRSAGRRGASASRRRARGSHGHSGNDNLGPWRNGPATCRRRFSTTARRSRPMLAQGSSAALPNLSATGRQGNPGGRCPPQAGSVSRMFRSGQHLGVDDARDRPRTINRAPAQNEEQRTMAKKSGSKVQLVCRIDSALHAKVRAQAARAGQTLTTFITRALEKATGSRSAMVAR